MTEFTNIVNIHNIGELLLTCWIEYHQNEIEIYAKIWCSKCLWYDMVPLKIVNICWACLSAHWSVCLSSSVALDKLSDFQSPACLLFRLPVCLSDCACLSVTYLPACLSTNSVFPPACYPPLILNNWIPVWLVQNCLFPVCLPAQM